jgi:hypothetical protein
MNPFILYMERTFSGIIESFLYNSFHIVRLYSKYQDLNYTVYKSKAGTLEQGYRLVSKP